MQRTIADLREKLFGQLEELSDTSKKVDLRRHRLRVDVSQAIIDSARVEVQLAAVLKGGLDVPFVEGQTSERLPGSAAKPPLPAPVVSPMQRTAELLQGGPDAGHPWRRDQAKRRA
ncbi:hypothetical protein [Variovorax sp. WDL1]|nr:hypothetical protein [Variovorax sp. WDL1]